MFTVQCSITNYPPTSRKHALKLQTSQVLHVKNKNHKNQLGSLKKKQYTHSPPKKNQKNPFSILALCATVIAYYQLHNNPPLKKKLSSVSMQKKKFSSRKLKFDKS